MPCAPNGEERILDNILGSCLLPQDLKGKAVGDPAVGVVQALNPFGRLQRIGTKVADSLSPKS
ncbi:MAG: hypothetical protein M3Z28_06315 [Candidatus Dormibacteraeota bacterium]|nr:hypothetical protein [Candidatus Dormibacteraeota bacterium]